MDKILIVDDSFLQSMMLETILKNKYTVKSVHDGRETVEAAEFLQPDLILLDVIMPKKNGFEVLDDLKSNPRTNPIPVILITSLSDIENEEKGLELGAVDYITKPFREPIVKARIQTHIQLYHYRKAFEQMAMVDALTKLPNRRAYDERSKQEWHRAMRSHTPLSIAVLDIDYFKRFNDRYGHPAGDVVLKTISSALSLHLKRGSDFAARFGGEEFVLLFPDTDSDHAFAICDRIRQDISQIDLSRLSTYRASISLTVSIGGVTVVPQQGWLFEDYFVIADQTLYKAKNSGKNLVLWYRK